MNIHVVLNIVISHHLKQKFCRKRVTGVAARSCDGLKSKIDAFFFSTATPLGRGKSLSQLAVYRVHQ